MVADVAADVAADVVGVADVDAVDAGVVAAAPLVVSFGSFLTLINDNYHITTL